MIEEQVLRKSRLSNTYTNNFILKNKICVQVLASALVHFNKKNVYDNFKKKSMLMYYILRWMNKDIKHKRIELRPMVNRLCTLSSPLTMMVSD